MWNPETVGLRQYSVSCVLEANYDLVDEIKGSLWLLFVPLVLDGNSSVTIYICSNPLSSFKSEPDSFVHWEAPQELTKRDSSRFILYERLQPDM